jgi:hypothetical protein
MKHNTFVCLTVVDVFGRSKEAGRFFAKPGIPKPFFFADVTEREAEYVCVSVLSGFDTFLHELSHRFIADL